MTEEERLARSELRENLIEAFMEAYPDMPEDEARHAARNLVQVINGVIDIGERAAEDVEITHMDVANAFVYWCVANTELEKFFKGSENGSDDGGRAAVAESEEVIVPENMVKLIDEFVARTADMLIGLQVLSASSELYRDFIRGSAVIGAYRREKCRAKVGR